MLISVCAFPDHLTAQVLLSWTIGGVGGSADFSVKIFLDIFRYFKNPPGLKYDDQKGGHVRVKPDYMLSLFNFKPAALESQKQL